MPYNGECRSYISQSHCSLTIITVGGNIFNPLPANVENMVSSK